MPDKVIIKRKLSALRKYVHELQLVAFKDLDEYNSNTVARRFVERNLELAAESMIDICNMIVAGLRHPSPESYKACFQILRKENIISDEELMICKSIVGFRNLLVHVYDGIDNAQVFEIYINHTDDYVKFADAIDEWLKNSSDK